MSTRVQKGGTKFRPVTNARPRASESVSRQASTVPETATRVQVQARPVQLTRIEEDVDVDVDVDAQGDEQGEESYEEQNVAPRASTSVPSVARAIPIPGRTTQIYSGSGSQVDPSTTKKPTSGPALIARPVTRQEVLNESAPAADESNGTSSEPTAVETTIAFNPTSTNTESQPNSSDPLPDTQATLVGDAEDNLVRNLQQLSDAIIQIDEQAKAAKPKRTPRKRSQQPSQTGSASERESRQGSEPSQRKRRRRKSVSEDGKAKRVRRPRKSELPAFDADGDPGEELDPTLVTMAAICEDTGQGRCSSKATEVMRNYDAWKQSNRERQLARAMALEAKKYGREEVQTTNAPPVQSNVDALAAAPEKANRASSTPGPSSENGGNALGTEADDGFNYGKVLSTNTYNVQVRIGRNGETIIDEETMFVDRAEDPEYAHQEYAHVEESDRTKFINSQSFSRKLRGSRWNAAETELFYDALSQFGENYELISFLLPGRDRKACKNKFKAEDKRNPNRITYCLKHRTPYDIQTLSRLTGKDFSGPTPVFRSRTEAPAPSKDSPAPTTTEAPTNSEYTAVSERSVSPVSATFSELVAASGKDPTIE